MRHSNTRVGLSRGRSRVLSFHSRVVARSNYHALIATRHTRDGKPGDERAEACRSAGESGEKRGKARAADVKAFQSPCRRVIWEDHAIKLQSSLCYRLHCCRRWRRRRRRRGCCQKPLTHSTTLEKLWKTGTWWSVGVRPWLRCQWRVTANVHSLYGDPIRSLPQDVMKSWKSHRRAATELPK